MNLIFLDTETTGVNLFEDYLFQVCYSHQGNVVVENFKPPVPISIKAQSINHVTNMMVEDKIPFKDSKLSRDLQEILKTNTLVAHNASFDICMLTKEGVDVSQFVCTLKVAMYLDNDCLIPEYNLQYLRYFYELDINADAHDAKGDVVALEGLFNILYQKMLSELNDPDKVIAKMVEISSQPFLYKHFTFGKYKGRKINEIVQLDKSYLEWLMREKLKNRENEEEDWLYTLNYYLEQS